MGRGGGGGGGCLNFATQWRAFLCDGRQSVSHSVGQRDGRGRTDRLALRRFVPPPIKRGFEK